MYYNTLAGGFIMGKRNSSAGIIFASLGLGLVISFILPTKFIVVTLAFSLVFCGIALCKK